MTNTFKKGDSARSVVDSLAIGTGEVFEVLVTNGSIITIRDREGDLRNRDHRFFERVEVTTPVKAPSAPKPGTRLDQALKHLLTGKTLTQGEAIVLGYGTRLAATIHRLKAKGHTIVATIKEDLHGSTYAEYKLVTRRANGNRKGS